MRLLERMLPVHLLWVHLSRRRDGRPRGFHTVRNRPEGVEGVLVVPQCLLLAPGKAPPEHEQHDADHHNARDDETNGHPAHSTAICNGVDRDESAVRLPRSRP